MRPFKDRDLQGFKSLKKGIRCFLIAHGSPKSFLIIQLRMVGRKIVKMHSTVLTPKVLHHLSPVPWGSIYPKIDTLIFETYHDAFEKPHKALGIALPPFHHAMQPINGSDPSKEIKPLLMLAPGGDVRLRSFLYPDTTQPRMKTKPAFVLKQNDSSSFALFGLAEFFLIPSEMPLPLPGKPEQTGTSAASGNTPTDVSTVGHG